MSRLICSRSSTSRWRTALLMVVYLVGVSAAQKGAGSSAREVSLCRVSSPSKRAGCGGAGCRSETYGSGGSTVDADTDRGEPCELLRVGRLGQLEPGASAPHRDERLGVGRFLAQGDMREMEPLADHGAFRVA